MRRRDFISKLATMLSAATGPSVLALEAFDRFKWKAPSGRLVAIINPEWINAPYEIVFAWNLNPPEPWIYSKSPMKISIGPGMNFVEMLT